VELMLNERIIKEGEEFNEKGGISTGGSNMSTPLGQRIELHLGIENNHWCKLRHNALDRFASHGINNDINIARRSRHAIHTRGESTGEHVLDTGCLTDIDHRCGKLFNVHRETDWLVAGGTKLCARRRRKSPLRTSSQPSSGSPEATLAMAPSCMRRSVPLVRSNASASR